VRRLFFSLIRRRSKNRHKLAIPAGTPAAANSARISVSVMSGARSTRPRISDACASMRAERRSPPSGPDATDPADRFNDHQRIALDTLTPKRDAAARHDAPAAIAATTRSRRSTDKAFDMPVGLPADRQLESPSASAGNPPRVNQIENRSSNRR